MKHLILQKLMLIAVLLTGSHAFAGVIFEGKYYDFSENGYYYSITSRSQSNPEVSLGDGCDFIGFGCSHRGASIPDTVTYNGTTFLVTSIGDGAFSSCPTTSFVKIPNSVTSIGDCAFNCCRALTVAIIGDRVKTIGNSAFDSCRLLEKVTIGNSVTHIGDCAFANCQNLDNIKIPNSVTSIGDYAFSRCYNLTSITIPNSVTSIGDYAFYSCQYLSDVTIGENVTRIGNCAFARICLGSISIPNSVTRIGYHTFGNSCLSIVTIGEGVTSIGEEAFYECNLKKIYCKPQNPPATDGRLFEVNNNYYNQYRCCILYVPVGCKSAYESVYPWSEFKNIEEYEFSGVETTFADDSVAISVENGNIVVNGATDNVNVEVYGVNGQNIYCGNATTIPIAVEGLYIVKVNGKSFKAII